MEQIINGRFEVKSTLGSGGFGQVFKVRDLQFPSTEVTKALKIPHLRMPDHAPFGHRFEREIKILLRLNHQNIAPIRDTGTTEDGRLFYTMDYCQGSTIQEIIKESGPLPVERALHFAHQILEALSYAHGQSVLHLDLKPANVMVLDPGGEDEVRLVDFGIGRIISNSEEGNGGTRMTKVMGTPSYLPPEQLRGEVDARSDVYAAGATLYEMFTGSAPFTGGSCYEVLERVHQNPPARISDVRVDPIPPSIERAIHQALAKDPKDRPGSAAAFSRLLSGEISEDVLAATEVLPAEEKSRRLGWRKILVGMFLILGLTFSILFVTKKSGNHRIQNQALFLRKHAPDRTGQKPTLQTLRIAHGKLRKIKRKGSRSGKLSSNTLQDFNRIQEDLEKFLHRVTGKKLTKSDEEELAQLLQETHALLASLKLTPLDHSQ